MDSAIIKLYEDYVEKFEEIVFNHLAIKLAAFRGFSESLKNDFNETAKAFPLLYFMVESLQVDCVISVSKLTEDRGEGKTIHKFLNFVESNLSDLQKKYSGLTTSSVGTDKRKIAEVRLQIGRILTQRDKYFAHNDSKYFLEAHKIIEDFPNTYDDLVDIVMELQDIVNSHRLNIKGNWLVCMSDFAYLNTEKTIELLKKGNAEWEKNKI